MIYTEVLKLIGYPTECLIIDFETFYSQDYSLNKLSTIEYIRHRLFSFTGVGYQYLNDATLGDDGPVEFVGDNYIGKVIRRIQSSCGSEFDSVTTVVKNAKFDITLLQTKFGFVPKYIIDIDDLLRYYDSRMSHRMKDVAPMFGLQAKGDTTQFKGLRYADMGVETKNNLAAYGKNDIEIETALFKLLLPMLSNPEVEIQLARHTLGLYLNPKISFDFNKAILLKKQMQERLEYQVKSTGLTRKQLGSKIFFPKYLQRILPDDEVVPMKPGKKEMIPALAKTDEPMQLLCTHRNERVRRTCLARLALKSWTGHISRINNMTSQAMCEGGKLRVPLNYYGAHTGRWTGGEKINLQNLGGRGRAGMGTDPLISAMRELLYAG